MAEATLRPDKVCGFHFFYPASIMPLLEIVEGADELAGDDHRRGQLRAQDPQAADHLRRGPGLRRQPDPQLGRRRDLARPGGAGPLDQVDRRGRRRRQRRADGPVHPRRHARPRHGPARRRAPQGVLRGQLLRPRGHAEAGRRRQARRQVRWRRLLQGRRAAARGRRRGRRREARRAVDAEGARRGLPGPRGGRLHGPRDRLRDDGRRRARPAPRPLPAVHEGRPDGPRRLPREARGGGRGARRALRAADDPEASRRPGPARARRAARASTPTRRPTRASRPTRSSSRAGATSRSHGWRTRR